MEDRRAIEAVLMVAESPVEPSQLAQLLELSPARVAEICHELAESYRDEQRGFELVRVAGGYRFQSHPDMAPYVERFVLEGQSARLSAAALETLAVVAYKQPVSRAQVAAIRGVNSDGVLRTLCIRGLCGRGGSGSRSGPGGALRHHTGTAGAPGPGPDRGTTAIGGLRARPGGHGRARAGLAVLRVEPPGRLSVEATAQCTAVRASCAFGGCDVGLRLRLRRGRLCRRASVFSGVPL